jgi:hypothetical protein
MVYSFPHFFIKVLTMKLFKTFASLTILNILATSTPGHSSEFTIPDQFILDNFSTLRKKKTIPYLETELTVLKFQPNSVDQERKFSPDHYKCEKINLPLSPKVLMICSQYTVFKLWDIRDSSVKYTIALGWGKPSYY